MRGLAEISIDEKFDWTGLIAQCQVVRGEAGVCMGSGQSLERARERLKRIYLGMREPLQASPAN
jgi:hypothetical protein